MPQVVIVDYGVGNLLSLKFALEKTGLTVKIAAPTKQLKKADAITLPGVGNFTAAAKALEPVRDVLVEIIKDGTPVLGICLGMQLYFETSEEGPGNGLAFFKGRNVRLIGTMKVPHMGWNTLRKVKPNELFDSVKDDAYVYFVHSLYPVPGDRSVVCTETDYGQTFASAVARGNIYGTQFHPEKSSEVGLRILKNFAKAVTR
ncbi:MAG: imidazole glycerol phosphate synthase subunit HisH [Candidatus Bathyarchaeia archaeon]